MGQLYLPTFSEMLAVSHSRGADSCAPHLWNGLVGYWPCAAGGGLTAFDMSGYGNHGTLTNMDPGSDWVVGEKGRALDFDGTDDYVDAGDVSGVLSLASPWTLATTGTLGALPNADDISRMVGIVDTAGAADDSHNITIGALESGGSAYAKIATQGETPGNGSALTLNAEFGVALVWDGTDFLLYLDGALDYSKTPTGSGWQGSKYLKIAKRRQAVDDWWTGTVGCTSLHSRALAPSEVQQLYAEPWCMVTPRARVFPAVVAAGGDITGDAAQTLAALTQSASGAVEIQGDTAQSLPAIEQSAAGEVEVSGDAGQTLPSLTQSAAGIVEVAGDAGQTLPSLTQSAAGSLGRIGTAAQVLPALEQSAAGEVNVQGVAAQTLPALDQAAAGTTATRTGEIAQSLPSLTQSAAGRPVTPDPYRVVAGGVWHAGAVAGQVCA